MKLCASCQEYGRAVALREKLACFDRYGGRKCNCCGETELLFLQLDHIDNNGGRHRRKENIVSLYRWAKKKKYPPGFQVLCANCNFGKHMNGGICPHLNTKDS